MNVIPPLTITDAMLISSTVSEPTAGSPSTESIYNAGTTYGQGDVVINAATHQKYESLAAGNLGNALTDTTKWLALGATNKWAMFDLLRNTATECLSPLTVVIAPGKRIDSIALLGMEGATQATISMNSALGSPQTNYYTHTGKLNSREVKSWEDYFFAEFSTKPSLILFDLPPYAGAYITITITGPGTVKCGACVLGTAVYLGEIEHNAVSDVLNFSNVTRDFAGGTALMVQRRNVPKTVQKILTDKSRVNVIRAVRDALNATPAVWSGLDDDTDGYFEALLIVGFYKRFSIDVALPENAFIDLELEEI